MTKVKVSAIVDAAAWNDMKALAAEQHTSLSGLLTEAIREYVARRRVRPEVPQHLEDSMHNNDELGHLLAQ